MKNADMGFHAAEQHLFDFFGFQSGIEFFGAAGAEGHFFHRRESWNDSGDLRGSRAKAFAILLGDEDRNAKDVQPLDESDGILNQPLFFKNLRQQALLNVYHDKGGVLAAEPSDFVTHEHVLGAILSPRQG